MVDTSCSHVLLMTNEVDENLLQIPAISVINFYRGKSSKEYLLDKIHSIVWLNHWLTGTVSRTAAGWSIVHNDAIDVDKIFSVVDDSSITQNLPYESLVSKMQPLVVKRGVEVVGTNEQIFKIVLVNVSPEEYAVVISLSHVVGDGHTFYQLCGMLDVNSSPKTIIVERIQDFKDISTDALGRTEEIFYTSRQVSWGVTGTMMFKKTPEIFVKYLNSNWVEKQKEEFAKNISSKAGKDISVEAKFISTNDILTSWFSKLVKSDFTHMVVNFRERIPSVTHSHGGNYWKSILYQPPDYASPSLIRASLCLPKEDSANDSVNRIAPLRRVVTTSLPSFFRTAFFYRCAVVTNWAGFYQDVQLPDSEMVLHLPIQTNVCPIQDLLIIFKPNKNDIAMLSISRSLSDNQLVQEEVVGESIL